eukprot:UN34222
MITFNEKEEYISGGYIDDNVLATGFGELTEEMILNAWDTRINSTEYVLNSDLTRTDSCSAGDCSYGYVWNALPENSCWGAFQLAGFVNSDQCLQKCAQDRACKAVEHETSGRCELVKDNSCDSASHYANMDVYIKGKSCPPTPIDCSYGFEWSALYTHSCWGAFEHAGTLTSDQCLEKCAQDSACIAVEHEQSGRCELVKDNSCDNASYYEMMDVYIKGNSCGTQASAQQVCNKCKCDGVDKDTAYTLPENTLEYCMG